MDAITKPPAIKNVNLKINPSRPRFALEVEIPPQTLPSPVPFT